MSRNYEITCRVCRLQDSSEDMVTLRDKQTWDKFAKCTAVSVLLHDTFPQQICKECHALLDLCHNFLTMAQHSDDMFRNETVQEIEMAESPWEFLYVDDEEEKEATPTSSSSAAEEESLLVSKMREDHQVNDNDSDREIRSNSDSLSSPTQSHRFTHKTKTVQCHWCKATFPKLNLKSHSCTEQKDKSVWQKEQKRFKCRKCCKTFHRRQTLELHLENHRDDKISLGSPEKVANSSGGLTEDKNALQLPWKCLDCNMGFLRLAYLTHHRYRTHGEREDRPNRPVALPPPFKCDKCPTRFFKECWLELHRSSVHKEE